jgi:cystathionine beta-lyase
MNFGYLPPAMATAMSQACADWQLRRYGWQLPAGHIHPLPDVIKALEIAIKHYSRPGSPVILTTPAYMPFLTVPGLLGREIIQVPMARAGEQYVLDLDGIDAAYRAGGDLFILCNPYNPLGRVFTTEELNALTEVVDRHGGRVFSDEIHAPLTYPGHPHQPYAALSETAAGHTVTATSASKAWNLPGLKCAQLVISNEADAQTLTGLGPFATHGASNLGVVANTAAFTSGGQWLDDVLGYLDQNRYALASHLAEHLPEVRYTIPEGTYFAWLDFRELGLGDHPGELLRDEAGIVLVDGPMCGDPGRGHARLNFATPRPILEHLITSIAEAVQQLNGSAQSSAL